MSKSYAIIKNLAYLIALLLCILFYDWKLFIILMLFGWGMNLENNGRPR